MPVSMLSSLAAASATRSSSASERAAKLGGRGGLLVFKRSVCDQSDPGNTEFGICLFSVATCTSSPAKVPQKRQQRNTQGFTQKEEAARPHTHTHTHTHAHTHTHTPTHIKHTCQPVSGPHRLRAEPRRPRGCGTWSRTTPVRSVEDKER